MTQLNIDDFIEQEFNKAESIKVIAMRKADDTQEDFLKGLTYRQKVLHYYLMEYFVKSGIDKVPHKTILEELDSLYEYSYEIKRKEAVLKKMQFCGC